MEIANLVFSVAGLLLTLAVLVAAAVASWFVLAHGLWLLTRILSDPAGSVSLIRLVAMLLGSILAAQLALTAPIASVLFGVSSSGAAAISEQAARRIRELMEQILGSLPIP